jgi:hypothetical protein
MKDLSRQSEKYRVSVKKPAGGFVFIKAEHLLRAWWAYRQGIVDLFAFRVWLACHELVARRCKMSRRLTACYRVEELLPLTGSANLGRHRAAIRRLQSAGLVRWLGDDISLTSCPQSDDDDFAGMRMLVQNWRRRIPVPRKTIKMLARERRKVVIATVLGHLFRCVYYRDNACLSGGRCKASWIAEVFGVDVRNVKAARGELIASGWLKVVPSSQTALNRWGLAVIVSLNQPPITDRPASDSPPRPAVFDTQSPPPIRNKKLSSRSNNQKLARGRTVGAQTREREAAPPCLQRIMLADLREPQRLDVLFTDAVECGILKQSQANRLNWFSAAERALQHGTQNPCGFFATVVRHGLWHYISNAQEDIARIKLKQLDYGESGPSRCPSEAA